MFRFEILHIQCLVTYRGCRRGALNFPFYPFYRHVSFPPLSFSSIPFDPYFHVDFLCLFFFSFQLDALQKSTFYLLTYFPQTILQNRFTLLLMIYRVCNNESSFPLFIPTTLCLWLRAELNIRSLRCVHVMSSIGILYPTTEFLMRGPTSITRGHPCKLYKEHSSCTARSSFFTERT